VPIAILTLQEVNGGERERAAKQLDYAGKLAQAALPKSMMVPKLRGAMSESLQANRSDQKAKPPIGTLGKQEKGAQRRN
jgi:hypothetical protein